MNQGSKILQYEAVINSVLRIDLASLEKKLEEKYVEQAEFVQLKSVISTLKSLNLNEEGFKTQVDLGNSFLIQANVEDASHMLLDIGLGHFLEVNLDEAVSVIDVRSKLLGRQIDNLKEAVASTNAYIRLIQLGIRELQGLDKDVTNT